MRDFNINALRRYRKLPLARAIGEAGNMQMRFFRGMDEHFGKIRSLPRRGLRLLDFGVYPIHAGILALCLLAPLQLLGQSSAGILATSRSIDWSNAGVVGGIPTGWANCVTSQCNTVNSGTVTATSINAAITSAPSNTVVRVPSGTFHITAVVSMKSNVVLRGAGAGSTTLIFDTGAFGGGCFLGGASICFTLDGSTYNNSSNSAPGQSNAANWTGGYSQNATSITVGTVGATGIHNGDFIYLDQANDTSVGTNLFNCDLTSPACSIEGGSPGRTISGVDHSQLQVVKVTAGCTSACTGTGPFTLTISPGLYGVNWSGSKAPGAWFPSTEIVNAGIENLTIDNQTGMLDNGSTIGVLNGFNIWVSGVAMLHGGRAHIWIFDGAHITVQNSYMYQTQDAASQSYGMELDLASDNLIVNNIMQQVTAPLQAGSQFGNVFAYNYMINHYQTASANCMYPAEIAHDAASEYNLWEGNFAQNVQGDVVHGTSGLNTLFRNQLTGFELGKTCSTVTTQFDPYNRDENMVGNILGTPGITTTYEGTDPFGNGIVYVLGQVHGGIGPDTVVKSTMLRWGNYDNVTGAVRFCGNSSDTGWGTTCSSTSEVPTAGAGSPTYANPVPTLGDTVAGQSPMPASFIYGSTPSWWPSGKPWPPIGPDVTSGNMGQCAGGSYPLLMATSSGQCTGGSLTAHVNAGHVNSVPAHDCYASLGGPPDGSGSALNFNAATCYAATPPTVATPTFSPAAGSYSTPQFVTISTATSGATIYYTVDGTTPTTSSAIYQVPLHVRKTQTLKALAAKAGSTNSAVASAAYTIGAQKTRFSMMRSNQTMAPVPFPVDDRMQPSSGVRISNIEATRGTYNWTTYDAWVSSTTSHASQVVFTYQARPNWMTGLGSLTDGPPTDLNTVAPCQNVLTGVTTTDCSMKEFTTAHMMHVTGLSSQPSSPVSCPNLDQLEAGNEVATFSGSSSLVGWSGTPAQFVQMSDDVAEIKAQWCTSATKMLLGSVSAVVGSNGTGNPQYDLYMAALLALVPQADQGLYQGVSFHNYSARDNFAPEPPPTSNVAYSGTTCTSGNTPNNSCYVPIWQQVTRLQSVALNQTSTKSWSQNLPVYITEGGLGKISQLNGDTNFGIAYVSEFIPLTAAQAPVNSMLYLAFDSPCGTSQWGCYWQKSTGVNSDWYDAFLRTTQWETSATSVSPCTTSSITGGTKWTCPVTLPAGAGEITWCAVQNPATCTTSTSFGTQQDISGAISPTGGSLTLNSTARLVYGTTAPASTPTFSPIGGSYGSTQTVTISTTAGGVICYNTTGAPATNGTTGCTTGTLYTSPVSVAVSETLYAVAGGTGFSDSPVGSAVYTINGAAATPVISPAAGAYGPAQSVTITDSTPGSTIYYTTDGSTPTTGSTVYSGAISVTVTTTVKAIAAASGFSNSAVASSTFTINGAAATPTFSPVAGSYGPTQTVTLSCATASPTMYYTTNGSTPTTSSALYSTPISVAVSLTIKAICTAPTFTTSAVGSAAYVINGAVATPTFTPAAGTYFSTQSVTIADATSGSSIFYTVDGSTPTTGSTPYSGAISVSVTTTVKAIASKTGFSNSAVASALYTITIPPVGNVTVTGLGTFQGLGTAQ